MLRFQTVFFLLFQFFSSLIEFPASYQPNLFMVIKKQRFDINLESEHFGSKKK